VLFTENASVGIVGMKYPNGSRKEPQDESTRVFQISSPSGSADSVEWGGGCCDTGRRQCAGQRLPQPDLCSQNRAGAQANALYVGHEAVAQFDDIPDWARIAASTKKVMFRHASVGGRISDVGLDCLQGTKSGSPCDSYPDYKYDRRNWDWLYYNPWCYSAREKIDQFASVVPTV